MTPSQQCKKAGLKSLAQMVEISQESKQTLINWHRKYPHRFRLLLIACVIEKKPLEGGE